jgi:hypothetical protein
MEHHGKRPRGNPRERRAEMSDEAFRVLGAAYREYPADSDLKELELEQELVFIGNFGRDRSAPP